VCGIAGLFLKNPALQPRLGELLCTMLVTLTDRGPDSAGIALYDPAPAGRAKLTLRVDAAEQIQHLEAIAPGAALDRRADHVVLTLPADQLAAARAALPGHVSVLSAGSGIEIYKAVGRPSAVVDRLGLAARAGTHGIGHTRMATESAVTTAGAHPFSTGPDQCLVHNGSLSNHNQLRRRLRRHGLVFETENDTEVAAAYLSHRLAEGASLAEALEAALADLDGFYTFVVGTARGFGVLRDPVACKPAVMAETDEWVAFGSEYRALAVLPGIDAAHVWEPEPARVYFWEH
jgi:amidophosphoribosyltransferase